MSTLNDVSCYFIFAGRNTFPTPYYSFCLKWCDGCVTAMRIRHLTFDSSHTVHSPPYTYHQRICNLTKLIKGVHQMLRIMLQVSYLSFMSIKSCPPPPPHVAWNGLKCLYQSCSHEPSNSSTEYRSKQMTGRMLIRPNWTHYNLEYVAVILKCNFQNVTYIYIYIW